MTFPFNLTDLVIVMLLLWIAFSERKKSVDSPSPTSEPLHTRDMRAAMNSITRNAIDLSSTAMSMVNLKESVDQQTKALAELAKTVDAMDKTLFNVVATVYRDRLSRSAGNSPKQVGEERPGTPMGQPHGTTTSSDPFPTISLADGFIDAPTPPATEPPTRAGEPSSAHT